MNKLTRRLFQTIMLTLMVLIVTPAAVSAVSETGRDADVELTEGVWESTIYVTESNVRNIRVHLLKINKGSNVSLKASTPNYYTKGSTKKTRTKKAKKWKKSSWGYAAVINQAKAYESSKDKAGKVIAGINGDYYSKTKNGKTLGKLMLEGNKINSSSSEPFFAVLKDGTYDIREAKSGTSDVVEAVAGKYWLMQNGQVVAGAGTLSDTITAIGVTAGNDVVIAVIDGREPTSEGTCGYDVGMIMKQQGCIEAIQLDCGGSTSFVTKRPGDSSLVFRNIPNDGYPRPVSSALLVVKNSKAGTTPEKNTAADSMKDEGTVLEEIEGILSYTVNAIKQSGFFTINNSMYLFDANGEGSNDTIVIGDTSYTFANGRLTGSSDPSAGKIAIGYCGADNGGKNLIYAYHYGDKKLNVGLNPYIADNSGRMYDWPDVIEVPWQTEKHRVKTVVVGEGVTNIGDYFLRISKTPFNQLMKNKKTVLKSVTLPSTITRIGKEAFFNHSVLKSITIPENVNNIATSAFAYNEKTVFTFKGDTPPTVGKNAFKTSGKKAKFKVKNTKKWKSFAKSKKLKKTAGFKGKVSYY